MGMLVRPLERMYGARGTSQELIDAIGDVERAYAKLPLMPPMRREKKTREAT